MGKNFTKSLGSKTLASLIPTTKEEEVKETTTPVKKVIKKPVAKSVVKKVQKEEVPIVKKKPVEAPPVVEEITEVEEVIQEEVPVVKAKKKAKATTKEATTVTTFRINDEHLTAVKAIAFWDRKKIQDVFNEALAEYIAKMPKATLKRAVGEYEKRHGK